ncbi:MAG: hypothetical protein KatS3mg090_0954 [Patescibacteria group bacterium]|nr:MAG: hypothetical protein KatS3mg090_0954 [Patescibacteria group bacterium]
MSLIKPFKKNSKVRIIITLLAILFLLAGLGYWFLYRPVMEVYAQAQILKVKANQLKETLKQNDIALAHSDLTSFKKDYQQFIDKSKQLFWLAKVPFVGSYVVDFENAVYAGEDFILAGEKVIEAIEPHADLLGLKKGDASFIEKPVEERIKTAVYTLEKIKPDINEISKILDRANKRLEEVDPNHYPEKIGNYQIREMLLVGKQQVLGLTELFVSAKPLLENLPEILGSDKEKTYLVLFQNDKELRATGGFWTAYAVFKIDKGNIKLEKSSDIYDLDNSISKRPSLPDKIKQYHLNVNQFYIRDSNLSPDFVESIKLFNSLYNNSSQKVEYDGIIAIDTHVLVDLLEIFGDTQVQGVVFSSRTEPKCDCPQAIYRLFDIIDRPTPYLRENRKGILGDLTYALFRKAIGFSPSRYWGRLVNTMIENMQDKHLILYFVDSNLQKAVESLNYAGRIRDYKGDYLHINNVNFAGAKSNMFVSQEVASSTRFEDGKVLRTVKIVYKNPYPHSDCNLERGGLCLNATLRNWLRVYVPEGSKLIEFKGSKTKVQTYDELNKTVFEGFLTVTPQGKAEVEITYQLPDNLVSEKDYSLLIQKQPGTDNDKFAVTVGNKELFNQVLKTDTEIKLQ